MNILKIIILTLIILVSFFVILLKPKMHKAIRIEKADFDVKQFSEKKAEPKPTPFYAPKQQATQAPVSKRVQNVFQPNNNVQPAQAPTTPRVVPQQQLSQPKPMPPLAQPQSNTKQLTPEQEEIIAWNKWRSNLQNQVMRDSEGLGGTPLGTEYNFSFTLDKFGNISNLRIWADPSAYTQIGVRSIRPVLMGYQGQPILYFPPKSKRVVINIDGHFYISRTSKYSSPSDYSDYERVK
jgi:hypothetical protein